MANQTLIITLLSNDQPGIVKQVADIIKQYEGNWLDSRMAQLGGKFAGILRVAVADSHLEQLKAALLDLSTSGIQLLVDQASDLSATQAKRLNFELVGADRPGIVSEISQAFSEKSINIDELETRCSSMPWSGEPLFEASGTLLAPEGADTDDLLDQLTVIEDKLGVDIKLTEQL